MVDAHDSKSCSAMSEGSSPSSGTIRAGSPGAPFPTSAPSTPRAIGLWGAGNPPTIHCGGFRAAPPTLPALVTPRTPTLAPA